MPNDVLMIGAFLLIKDEDDSYIQFQSGNSFRQLSNKAQGIVLRQCAANLLKEADEAYPLQAEESE